MRRPLLVLAAAVLALELGATAASAHDCASQADCEETTGYIGTIGIIGGIVAIITAILGTDLGTAAGGAPTGRRTTTAEPPAEKVRESVDGLIWDPWDEKPLIPWDPTKYAPPADGRVPGPGWVWFGGDWVPPDEARDRIREGLDADARRARESEDFWRESQELSKDWMGRRRKELEREAADERRQRELQDELDRIRDAAGRLEDDEIWRRASDYTGKDGRVDEDYVRRLKETMRRRLGREPNPPEEPPGSWVWEGTKATLQNPIVRAGIGVATGGYSEAVYMGNDAWENMRRRLEELDKQGKAKNFDLTDAFRAGMGGAIKERLPTNTYTTLTDPNATWGDVAKGFGTDLLTTAGGIGDVRNVIKSGRLIGGGNFRGSLTATADPLKVFGKGSDPAKWPGQQLDDSLHIPKPIKGLDAGTTVRHAEDFGMTPRQLADARRISEKFDARIDLRPPKQATIDRLRMGDNPKPPWVKQKTIGDDDLSWGAPPGEKGRVVHYEPRKPSDPALMPEYERRLKQFQDNDVAIKKMEQQGLVFRDKSGVLRDPINSKPFTGDIDAFDLKVKQVAPDGTTRWVDPPPAVKAQIDAEMSGSSLSTQHGSHMDWVHDGSAQNTAIDRGVLSQHVPGETPLVRVEAGAKPHTAYYDGPVDRSAQMQDAWNNVKGEVKPKFYEEGFVRHGR